MIIPGTAMPWGLFKRDGNLHVFVGPMPLIHGGYAGDHPDLLVRYMFPMTPEEQQRLVGMSADGMNLAALTQREAGPRWLHTRLHR